ncbi:MAG: protein phosphatase 2C domain-containing protein [Magnetococcus sp. DMHC-6]
MIKLKWHGSRLILSNLMVFGKTDRMVYILGDRFRAVGRSDVGRVRTLNEDNFIINEALGLLIVADGMGGHDAGEVASAQVIASIQESLQKFMHPRIDPNVTLAQEIKRQERQEQFDIGEEPTLDDLPNPLLDTILSALNRANHKVHSINAQKGYPEGMGMGSTVVGFWLPKISQVPVIFHVGDSRLYLFRRGRLVQVTQDHSMYQQWKNYGGKGRPPAQNILLQAMGPAQKITPDIQFQDVQTGDIILICSDGLSGMLSDAHIGSLLAQLTEKNMEKICHQLVDDAKEAGGKDNITVILGHIFP